MTEVHKANLGELAAELREKLETKKCILLYAYNGTGKTRLSMEFRDIGKRQGIRDTLYFNAFTEDLFSWDNDLEHDSVRVLRFNSDSAFFTRAAELALEERIFDFIERYIDFDFRIDYENSFVSFSKQIKTTNVDGNETTERCENIKISRGEENIFIWGFFLAILQLALDKAESYEWVKYIYIDDPVSSLDENNVITLAHQLAKIIKNYSGNISFLVSSHHTLFFNVLYNEMSRASKHFIHANRQNGAYVLRDTSETPAFHHIASLVELYRASQSENIQTYHFNMLRNVLEKTAIFHGHRNFSACIKINDQDEDGVLHTRVVNIINHGDYSLYDPVGMLPENMKYFRDVLNNFLDRYAFNRELFDSTVNSGES